MPKVVSRTGSVKVSITESRTPSLSVSRRVAVRMNGETLSLALMSLISAGLFAQSTRAVPVVKAAATETGAVE